VGIRETINQNPKPTAAVTAAIVVLAILFIFWQACGGTGGGAAMGNKAFYTTDDGKTYFPDDSSNIPPYLAKNGKMAVRARVFSCDDGKTKFVGYLEMYAPQDKMMMEQMAKAAQTKGGAPPPAYIGFSGQAMVKRPGDPPNAWVPLAPQTTTMYQAIVQSVKCPGGGSNENLSSVYPD
jgi:hypothetical protein